ncbi:chorismate dehydratase [Abditibacterium utsteinense]|uniref:Chorismate dehydratase n=1 Tax=Abditibacterium utsteinense TaxID=1960156 RepID=A0A2S8SVF0_9BACT|nr:menaquinone biosynthesis protein [Abditibacterium utsteinense]PQV64768.1 chorismate dehydratase [Abditibacterium utsteinense]
MKFKLGIVPYLNPLPLYFSLRNRSDIEITLDFPSNLGARLQNGEFDAALLPIADHIRGIGDGILGDGIVGATREVRSVLLLSRVDIQHIRSVALDTSSHSSVALTRVILRDFYGLQPQFSNHAPDLNAMLQRADAAVLIGDPALVAFQNSGDLRVYDLASLWHKWTKKSFVFAAWIARNGLKNRAELADLLDNARDDGQNCIAEIIQTNPIRTSLSDSVVESYLTNAIEYRLTTAHRAGLNEFAARLHAL